MAAPNLTANPILEAVTWAAASGNLEEIKSLLAAHRIPREVREFGAEVAAAGDYHHVANLLKLPRQSRARPQQAAGRP